MSDSGIAIDTGNAHLSFFSETYLYRDERDTYRERLRKMIFPVRIVQDDC
jgi:hypothetical protein